MKYTLKELRARKDKTQKEVAADHGNIASNLLRVGERHF